MTTAEEELQAVEVTLRKTAEELGELNLSNNQVTRMIVSIMSLMRNYPKISKDSSPKLSKRYESMYID